MFVRGVTLLELLVVLVVVGVIGALALPAYRQHLVRVNRTEATTTLYEVANAEERYYLRYGRYARDIAAAPPDGLGITVATRHYGFSVALADDSQSFIASATPARGGGQEADGECLVFSLDHRGRRAVSGTRETSFCWR